MLLVGSIFCGTMVVVATLLLFAQAREAASVNSIDISASDVQEVLNIATDKFGSEFSDVLKVSKIWINGKPANLDASVSADDEVAIIPPVSGG